MALIQCDGCNAVHESTLPVCPACGRCPGCGDKRATKQHLREWANCPACQAPYCFGSGRCHVCGAMRFADWEACSCGYPADPDQRAEIEKIFAINRTRGCLSVLALGMLSGAAWYWT